MLELVLSLLTALSAPSSFAASIAWVATHDPPPAGMSRELGAALLVVYGWEEGKLALHVEPGDNGLAHCTYQVHATGARAAELERDPLACTRAAYATLRASYTLCGDGSGYCGACRGKLASAIAARRFARAELLLFFGR